MYDPLEDFQWEFLKDRYEAKCEPKYQAMKKMLGKVLYPVPLKESELYEWLIGQFSREKGIAIKLATYEAMLFWKLYTIGLKRYQDLLVDERLAKKSQDRLLRLELPPQIEQDSDAVLRLLRCLNACRIHGMKTSNLYAVRTTFLHFAYPDVVPIFDKQARKALRYTSQEDNERLPDFCNDVWRLADKYSGKLGLTGLRVTPVRLIDMALWVHRGG